MYSYEDKKTKCFLKKARPKYPLDERKHAVTYFLIHRKSTRHTCRELEYLSYTLLVKWIVEDIPTEKQYCKRSFSLIKYTKEQKKILS